MVCFVISEFGIPSAIGILGRIKRSSGKKWMFWMFRSTIVVYQIGHGRLVLWRFLPLEGTRAERISSRSWTQNDRKESRVGGTCIRRKPDGSRHEKEFDIGKGETQTRLFSIAKNKWWHNTRSSVLERVGVGAVWHNAVAPFYVLWYCRIFVFSTPLFQLWFKKAPDDRLQRRGGLQLLWF